MAKGLLLVTFVFLLKIQNGLLGTCPEGWLHHASSCYLFSKDTGSWWEASSHCAALNGELATVKSEVEDSFIRSEIMHIHNGSAIGYNYWIGGTDFAKEGVWVWGKQEMPIDDYMNWCPGEPNSLRNNQDCMDIHGNCGLGWDDEDCDGSSFYICELPQMEFASNVIG